MSSEFIMADGVTSLTYCATIDDADRCSGSRAGGAYGGGTFVAALAGEVAHMSQKSTESHGSFHPTQAWAETQCSKRLSHIM